MNTVDMTQIADVDSTIMQYRQLKDKMREFAQLKLDFEYGARTPQLDVGDIRIANDRQTFQFQVVLKSHLKVISVLEVSIADFCTWCKYFSSSAEESL